jgi:hypothetical protein
VAQVTALYSQQLDTRAGEGISTPLGWEWGFFLFGGCIHGDVILSKLDPPFHKDTESIVGCLAGRCKEKEETHTGKRDRPWHCRAMNLLACILVLVLAALALTTEGFAPLAGSTMQRFRSLLNINMQVDVSMPALSSTMKEGKIVAWGKKIGESVVRGYVARGGVGQGGHGRGVI